MLRYDGSAVDRSAGFDRVLSDALSLHLVEEALTVYRSGTVLEPGRAPDVLKDACSLLDFELMRLPLRQAGWPLDTAIMAEA